MSHHHARFKKNSYIGFQEESKQVFWAHIWVKMPHFGTLGAFYQNLGSLTFFKA